MSEQESQITDAQEAGAKTPQTQDQTFSLEYVQELRQENADRRIKLREAMTQLESLQNEVNSLKNPTPEAGDIKSLADELRAELAKVQRENKQMHLTNQVISKASQMGFSDPQDAIRFLELEPDSGTEEITTALSKLLEVKPYLKKPDIQESPTGPQTKRTNPAGGAADPQQEAKRMINDMLTGKDGGFGRGGIIFSEE